MKKIIVLISLALATLSAGAQDFASIYNKYSDEQDISAIYVSPTLFKMMGRLPDVKLEMDSIDFGPTIRSLSGFYLLSTKHPVHKKTLTEDVQALRKKGRFDLLLEFKESGEAVKFYMISKGDIVNSLLMIANDGDETIFIGLDGEMYRKDLEKLLGEVLEQQMR